MRIKHKILITTAAIILLPMALSTLVIALLVERQNRLEAEHHISNTLNNVLSDIDLQANHLQRAMRNFARSQDVSESLRFLLDHAREAGSQDSGLRVGNRIATEMRKLTASTQVDRVAFYDPDGYLLAEHHIEGGDSLFSVYLSSGGGAPQRWFVAADPRLAEGGSGCPGCGLPHRAIGHLARAGGLWPGRCQGRPKHERPGAIPDPAAV